MQEKNMNIVEKSINTIRKLGLNMVESANSGHTGIVLGASPIIYSIYHEAKVNPRQPDWFNRDRVVLSSGHGSAMLYAILHLMGYDITTDDMRDFRTLGSITPGHPEIDITPGVDCTTGALGQGFANAVGIAMAESHLSAVYNKTKLPLVVHYTFVQCGDGDLMEGVCYESASMAGKNKLNKLIALFDSNNISLDGETNLTTNEDIKARFIATGWNVLETDNHADNIITCIRSAKSKQNTKPTLIICHTIIGENSKFANTNASHGNPFKEGEYAEVVKNLGLNTEPYQVDIDVYKHFNQIANYGKEAYADWQEIYKTYKKKYKLEYKQLFEPDLEKVADSLDSLKFDTDMSTRDTGHIVLNETGKYLSNLFGGCADLSKSTLAFFEKEGFFSPENKKSRNIAFGLREHAMSAICNGICLHGGVRSFASTFLIFSDYMRYALRMSALMDMPVLYVFTHDSIAVGQDGATHEPIEQLESLRLIPNLEVFRPADGYETVGAMQWYLKNHKPMVLALSRQKLPFLTTTKSKCTARGGYIVSKEQSADLNAIIIASGSEVELAIRAQKLLQKEGFSVRVVSMPNRDLFLLQSKSYKEKIIPSYFPSKIAIETGVTNGWESMVGRFGEVIGINTFGESGTQSELFDLFGISVANINNKVKAMIKRNKTQNIEI